jgi:hypothetical protein
VHDAWTDAPGEFELRKVRWNGRPRARGDLRVTGQGFDWRSGKVRIPWDDVLCFDVMRVGRWETAGGRSLSVRGDDDPRVLDHEVIGAVDGVIAAGYRRMDSYLIVETDYAIDIFTTAAKYRTVCTRLRFAIDHFHA